MLYLQLEREVRIRAQDINVDGYAEDFYRLGESIRRTQIPAMTISFGTENEIGQLNTEKVIHYHLYLK